MSHIITSYRVQPTGYVNFVNSDKDLWCIAVECTRPDAWAVRWRMRCLNRLTGEWDYEPQPSSRSDHWLKLHRWMRSADAIAAAEAIIDTLTMCGRTAAEASREIADSMEGQA